MNLQTILDIIKGRNSDFFYHWSGVSFGGGNVYEQDNKLDLINDGAALGESGQENLKYSGTSINLNGGRLFTADSTFLNTKASSDRKMTVSFSFRTTEKPSGLKYIVSRWNPEQQWMVGFENGDLVAKIQTSSGVVTITFPNRDKVLYSGRWNYVTFEIRPDNFVLRMNGVSVTEANVDSVTSTTVSPFTVGQVGANAFTTDFYINDLTIFDNYYSYFNMAAYKLPRTDKEIYLDLNPLYYFDLAEHLSQYGGIECPNLGSKGGSGFLTNGARPNISVPYTLYPDKKYHTFEEETYFSIDNSLDITESPDGYHTIMGDMKLPYTTDNNTTADHRCRVFDFSRSLAETNIDRILVAHYEYSSYDGETTFRTYDSSGSIIGERTGPANRDASSLMSVGISSYNFNSVELQTVSSYSTTRDVDHSFTDSISLGGYAPTVPLTRLHLFHYTTPIGSGRIQVRDFVILNWRANNAVQAVIQTPRDVLKFDFLDQVLSFDRIFTGVTSGDYYRTGYSNSGFFSSDAGVDYDATIVDPLSNKSNIGWAMYFDTSYTDRLHDLRYDNNGMSENNFTLSFFIFNRNISSQYVSFRMRNTNSGSYDHTIGTEKFAIRVNQRNGGFSHGDLEIGYNEFEAGYTISTTSQKIINDGFHHVVWVRRGVVNELWIDGILEETLITPNVYNIGVSHRQWGVYGNDTYYYDISINSNTALSQSEIEFLYGGFSDRVTGYCTLNNDRVESEMVLLDDISGEIFYQRATDPSGNFDIRLPKKTTGSSVYIGAVPTDNTVTNHVVVHGPYSASITYSKYTSETLPEYSDMIEDMQPLAWYPLDEESGTTATDNGSSGNATYDANILLNQDGPIDGLKSVYFEAGDAITLPSGFSDFTNGYTFEVLVKTEDSPSSYPKILTLTDGGSNANTIINAYEDSTDRVYIYTNSTSDYSDVGVVKDNNWCHLAFTVDKDGVYRYYANGNLVGSGSATIQNATRTANHLGRGTVFPDNFVGYMSNAVVYDFCLPEEDIVKHAKRAFNVNSTTLKSLILAYEPIAYWTFDRLDDLTDVVLPRDLTATGTYDIEKNSLVLNDVVGNNYLSTSSFVIDEDNVGVWSFGLGFKTATDMTDGILLSQWDQSSNSGAFKLTLESGVLRFYYNAEANYIEHTVAYDDDVWHFVVVSRNTFGDIELYFDNTLVGTVNTSFSNPTHDIVVGNDSSGDASWYLEGRTEIDDLFFMDNMLTGAKVNVLYEQFLKKKETL